MGTTRRFKYRIECNTNDRKVHQDCYTFGTNKIPKTLQEWCESQEKSEMKDGVNEHCAIARGFLLAIHSARLIRQSDGEIVAWYKAAPFRAF
jgi:hypothetical protein